MVVTVSIYGGVQIHSSNVVAADLGGTKAVVHIIDSVLVPPSFLE